MTTPHVLILPADMSAHERDDYWMQQAPMQAKFAWGQGEAPVGTMAMRDNEIIGMDYNVPIGTYDSSTHAKTHALRQAAEKLDNYHLPDCEVFVTLKPCVMCAGAMLHTRAARVAYGAPDPRTGAADSILNLSAGTRLNHQTAITGSVLAQEYGDMLYAFSAERRTTQKAACLAATESDESTT